MDYLLQILEKIKNNYALIIGKKSLVKLSDFIAAYDFAIFDITKEYTLFNSKFQIFIEYKIPEKNSNKHWSEIILNNYPDDAAFDYFFVCFDEFKELIKTPEKFDDMLKSNQVKFLSDIKNNI